MKNTLVFTGGYTQPLLLGDGKLVNGSGDGITVYRLGEGGSLVRLTSCEAPNPTYIALDKGSKKLYAVNELKECGGVASSAVSAYGVDAGSGALNPLGRELTFGEDACNITLSPDGGHVLASNFTGGSIAVFPSGGSGALGRMSCFFQHKGSGSDPLRQGGPHAHQALPAPDGRYVIVPDLGTDEIMIYEADWDKGHMIPVRSKTVRVEAGMGPRIGIFDASGRRLYLVAELGSAVLVYDYDPEPGTLTLLQTIPMLPDDYKGINTAACVKLHPNGKLLFASNRGHDSIAAYGVGENGLLSLLRITPSGGKIPRDFDITPDGGYLIVGNQDSGELVVFALDADDGALEEVRRYPCGSVTAVVAAELE